MPAACGAAGARYVVNFHQLKTRFAYEVRANPKKAAILGLLGLVCAYFWAPLLAAWMPGAAATSPEPPPVVALPQAASPPPTSTPPPADKISWRERMERPKHEVWMQPAEERFVLRRNPFAMPRPAASVRQPDPTEPAAVALETKPHATPQEAGLSLTSTIVGPRRRLALINGQIFERGAEIVTDSGTVFRLAEIVPGKVILHDGRKPHELEMPMPGTRPSSAGARRP